MTKYIALTFLFMGWAWYELSGGEDFEPRVPVAAVEADAPAPEVTRADTGAANLLAVKAKATPAVIPVVADAEKIRAVTQPNPNAATVLAAIDRSELENATGQRVLTDAVDPTTQTIADTVFEEPKPDIRYVTGNRVNMRTGPGTNYSVIARLGEGEEVLVLQEPGNGWLKLRTVETNRIGWMADFLVQAAN
ncbi:SH3 domain-containing protein [Pseudoprimorskyibacter insulae]|uniref:SH3b domain-containing protein n=1 Tax=Pseudoprimorskyibacter insulae TaxID=1695997 RepID=A0A2R8ANT3_9RHOB|nr:SH3 domain-containing protein [Pseudoprimorskyibacter insulae]SPF77726.1 hypothetical protein PRI8871_00310 [Pseudoprimorskyibacter insulae]